MAAQGVSFSLERSFGTTALAVPARPTAPCKAYALSMPLAFAKRFAMDGADTGGTPIRPQNGDGDRTNGRDD